MDRTSYTNLAKSWEYVEDHAFSRQSTDLNAIRTHAEEAGIPQGSAAQAELLRMLVHMVNATSVIAVGTGSVVETLQLVNGLDNSGQLTAVDSSSQGIALIRTLFNRLSDETQTTLRAVNAPVDVFLPRLNAENYDLIVVAGDAENYGASFEQAPRLLKKHGVIVFTDILAFDSATSAGGVLNPANRDAKSIAMRGLLETVESDESFVTALTPTGTVPSGLPFPHTKSRHSRISDECRLLLCLAYGAECHTPERRYLTFGCVSIIWLTTTVPSSNTDSTSPAASSSAV